MKKHHNIESTPTLDKLDLIGTIEDHPFIEWITKHGQILLYSILGLFGLLFVIYFFSSSKSKNADQDFAAVYQDFSTFQRDGKFDPAVQKQNLNKLEEILDRQPTLHAKYDGLIAQALLTRNDVTAAKPLATATLERVSKDDLPLYNDYSINTLLIAEGKYQEALKSSEILKQKILENASAALQDPSKKSFGDVLYAFNLLRIGMLQQQLGLNKEELKTWQEWKDSTNFAKLSTSPQLIDTKAFFAVANVFEEGQVSLASYIENREKQLQR